MPREAAMTAVWMLRGTEEFNRTGNQVSVPGQTVFHCQQAPYRRRCIVIRRWI